jgi:hypothetical protein
MDLLKRRGMDLRFFSLLPPVSRNVHQVIQQWSMKMMGHPVSHLYKFIMKSQIIIHFTIYLFTCDMFLMQLII